LTTGSNWVKGLLRGVPVSEGIAIGKASVIQSPWDEIPLLDLSPEKIDLEIERYRQALKEVKKQLLDCRDRVKKEIGDNEAEIFDTHLAMLDDPFFTDEVIGSIKDYEKNAEFVLKKDLERFQHFFDKMTNEYFKNRIDDIQDVATRVLRVLLQSETVKMEFKEPTIIVANNLTPSDTTRIDPKSVIGFSTELGGQTSHASILARSMGLPAVVGVENLMSEVRSGKTLIVDGNTGIVYINPPQKVLKDYEKRRRQFKIYLEKLAEESNLPSQTACGEIINLYANVSMTPDVSLAVQYHAEGIGLFRTELPFLISGKLLDEEEQFQIYRAVVEAFKTKTVVIRTLDLGGDKFLPFQDLKTEKNPFLGWRSIRIFLQEKDLFKKQLRAILRVSHFGNVKILYPMISSKEEVDEIQELLEICKSELQKEGIPFDRHIQSGIMIEIPSAAICSDILIHSCDFFSIGTNDLIQYTLAVDRNNQKVSRFYQPLNPAILRLIHGTVQSAIRAKKPVSLCGEMAGNPFYTAMLLGLGLRVLSMSPLMIPEVKERIRAVRIDECEALAATILATRSDKEVHSILLDFHKIANARQTVPYLADTEVISVSKRIKK
jgi:phosphotransferase system enzyme I (PtsI)